MRRQFSSKNRNALPSRALRTGCLILSASLRIGIALWPHPAFAQASFSANIQTPPGLGATLPFSSGRTQRAGIPLGSTEIAKPGISPVIPSQTMGAAACSDLGNARTSSALFDGGGLSGGSSLSCAGSAKTPSSASSSSAVGRTRIPLGATELGNAGSSPLLPPPGFTQLGGAIAAPGGSMQPTSNAGMP
jgi:hypothetical protein